MAIKNSSLNEKIIKAALALHDIGYIPLPLFPNSDVVSVDFGVWIKTLSPSLIRQYWRLHPNHGLSTELFDKHNFCFEYDDDAVFHE